MSSHPPRSSIHTLRFATLAAGVALSLAFSPIAGVSPAYAQSSSPIAAALPSFAPLVKKVMPAVVNVSATLKPGASSSEGLDLDNGDQDQDQDQGPDVGPNRGFPQSPFDEMLRRFVEQQGRPMQRQQREHTVALGSGFIIDPSGYIVTNNHVVQNADKVTVIFQDNSEHTAKIIGRDTKTDLALLKIDAPKPLPYVSWGNSDTEQVGDWVLAVGNPFGLGGSVSPGFVSARGRDIHAGPYDDFLQIDASINRGNSGGPTFNLNGEVIGINTAIYSPNGGSVGIGFAIPSSLAKPVIDQLRAHGKVDRGWLGVQIQQVTPEIAKSLGLPKDEGALVADVTPGGPAAKAGFQQGDVILSFNGHAIHKVRDLPIVVAETPVGNDAKVHVWRKSGETDLNAKIAQMPENPKIAQNSRGNHSNRDNGGATAQNSSTMGLRLAPLTNEWRQRLHIGKDVKGVVVTSVSDNSPLADLGLQRGDVIESVNQKSVTSPSEVVTALNSAKNNKGEENVLILLNRNGVNQYVALSLSNQGNG
ncbi:MAG TPA: DegQ family serine endoprotease [Stellaceae bacterium]|nr:DegQ family serine endoprotease [Stellaceae bacterium]